MVRISEVDPADRATLRAFWETEQESVWHDRPHATPRTWDRLVAMMSHPNDWYRRTLLVARDGDVVVGTADLGGSTTDNLHLADLEIHVRPARRRSGIGRALHDEASARLAADGRTSVCGEVYVQTGAEPSVTLGVRVRHRHGLRAACTSRTTCCWTCPCQPIRSPGCVRRSTRRRTTS